MRFYWADAKPGCGPCTAAFRFVFDLSSAEIVNIRVFGASWFRSWLDGGYFTEGPYRFDADHPQYEEREVTLAAGRHVLAAEVRADDVDTRILKKMPPFFGAEFICRGQQIGYGVKTALIDGIYLERRINPQLGYSEERDLNSIPLFINAGFDDGGWNAPVEVFPFGCVLTRGYGVCPQRRR